MKTFPVGFEGLFITIILVLLEIDCYNYCIFIDQVSSLVGGFKLIGTIFAPVNAIIELNMTKKGWKIMTSSPSYK